MRKFIIGCSAVGFVALLFLMYALIVDTQPIEVLNTTEADNLDMPETADTLQEPGNADVRAAELARYVALDPQTKEISRVFGFQKLLSRQTDASHRQVEKPYMIFYDSEYQCRIDADSGMFQIESSGASATPKDARLSGNVKIHLTPKPGSKISETIIEMDDLVFSSERSEFATDRSVYIKSDQVEMKGNGLIVILDPASGRIDYLRIRDLDQIRMQTLANSKSKSESREKTETSTASQASAESPKDGLPAPSTETAVHEIRDDKTEKSLQYYQCLLEDNVKIEYGDEIIVSGAEQVKIKNILLDKDAGDSEDLDSIKNKPTIIQQSKKVSTKEAETVQKIESSLQIIVTCDGGITLKPMQDEDAEKTPVSQSVLPSGVMPMPLKGAPFIPALRQSTTVGAAGLAGVPDALEANTETLLQTENSTVFNAASDSNNSPPAKFEANKIDYDLLTGSGLAHGPIRFTFYQSPDPNSSTPASWVPIVTTADENAQFIADSSQTIKQVVFNGNVMTTRESSRPDFVQLDKIHSEKLTIDLEEVQDSSIDLGRLSVTEGRVYVESQRTRDDRELSRVKLYCTEISYDKASDVILAQGPGKIEMLNSEDTQTESSNSNNPMDRPCVLVLDNFTAIRWDMRQQNILADGQQGQLELSYVPLLDGKPEKFIIVNAIYFDLSFITDSTGKTAIKRVFTDRPIDYVEKDGNNDEVLHKITGGKLNYNAVDGDGWIIIEETSAVPCYLDGWRTPQVLVNPVTGEIKTSISTIPGVLKGR